MTGLQSEIFCLICNKQYRDDNLPRILTACGHTYCQLCISRMITSSISEEQADNGHPFLVQCPEDGAKMKLTVSELKTFPVNLALIKVLEAKKSNSSFKDESFNLSKIVKQQEIQEDDQTTQLISAMNQCKQTQSCQDSNNQIGLNGEDRSPEQTVKSQVQIKGQKYEDEICLLHQKPLQIICINDNKKICSKCAIFGQHKGHDFKSIQELQRQRNQCYMQILEIFKDKEQTQQRMCNQETQSGLIQILDKKRDLLQKQLKQEFRKLRQQIDKQQKTVLKCLHSIYRNTQAKIKSLLKIDQNVLKDFVNWQIQSYDLLKILQDSQLQPKINVLYSKQQKNIKIVQEGKQILQRIQQQQSSLVSRVQDILVALQCKKNGKIYQLLPDFLLIQDKPQKIIQQKFVNAREKSKMMRMGNLMVESSQNTAKENIQNSNCTVFGAYTHKNNPIQRSPLLEQSLLDAEETSTTSSDETKHQVNNFTQQYDMRLPLRQNSNYFNQNNQRDSISCSFIHLQLESLGKLPERTTHKKRINDDLEGIENRRNNTILTSRPSIMSRKQAGQKPTKKKLKGIKISERYQKMLEGIYNNTVDTIDLTNAQAGDQTMLQICQFIKHSKARTIKLMRNKLTDSGIQKMLPMLQNAQILNLSQNNLTQGVLDILIRHRRGCLSGLKNVILSQNKIIERKHKVKIDHLRAMNIVVSV